MFAKVVHRRIMYILRNGDGNYPQGGNKHSLANVSVMKYHYEDIWQ